MKIQNRLDFLIKMKNLLNRKEKIEFLGVMVIGLVSAFFQTLSVISLIPFINLVMNPDALEQSRFLMIPYNLLGFNNVYSFTVFLGFSVLGIIIASNFILAFSLWLKIRFVCRKNHNLSLLLLKKYLSLPYVYFLDKHSADLSKNILAEVEQITVSMFMPLLSLITSGMMTIVIFITLIIVNPVVALTAIILFTLFYGITFFYLRNSLKEKSEKRLKENRGRFTSVGEAVGGIKDIKALGREKYFLERFSEHSISFSRLQAWSSVVSNVPRYVIEIIAFGGIIILILALMARGESGRQIIPMVSFFVFAGYRLMPALQDIFRSFTCFQFNKVVLDKIYKDVNEKGSQYFPREIELPERFSFQNNIAFNNVSFLYPNKKEYVLKDINFQVKKGTSIGIIGSTGGGKTTLVDIVLCLLTPNKGSIEVDGVEIKEENIRNWQRNIGYVPQQIYMSDDTITRNIAFGIPEENIDIEQVKQVAKIANIDTFIEKELPQGYDAFVGERGVRLSGGQKQRIGIARALYHDPEVLILDEATSSLDGITEKAVLKAMDNVAKLKTVIIVAHRLKTVEHCDMLYLLDKGEIIAQGNYQELLKNSNQFQKMII